MDKNQIIHAVYKKHKLLVVFIVMLLCSVSTSRAIHFLSVSSSFVSRYKHELDFVKYLIIISLLLFVERPFSLVRREGGERFFLWNNQWRTK